MPISVFQMVNRNGKSVLGPENFEINFWFKKIWTNEIVFQYHVTTMKTKTII